MQFTDINRAENAITLSEEDKSCQLLPQAFIILGIVSVFFAAIPEIDLIVSRFFWEPGIGFVSNNNTFLIAFRDANRFLPWLVIGIAVVMLIPTPLSRHFKAPPAPHKLVFVLTFFAAGPGLGVHLIKMLVGRARPRALEEFGGNALFTPPWEITNQCFRNCSFISGEAASAFALLTLVVFTSPKYSKIYLAAVGIVAAAFSFNRVIFGAHFLSDVVIAWCVMFVLAALLWRMFSRSAPQIDAIFTRQSRQN